MRALFVMPDNTFAVMARTQAVTLSDLCENMRSDDALRELNEKGEDVTSTMLDERSTGMGH